MKEVFKNKFQLTGEQRGRCGRYGKLTVGERSRWLSGVETTIRYRPTLLSTTLKER